MRPPRLQIHCLPSVEETKLNIFLRVRSCCRFRFRSDKSFRSLMRSGKRSESRSSLLSCTLGPIVIGLDKSPATLLKTPFAAKTAAPAAMPRHPTARHRIQRQFHPCSARLSFSKERLVTPPPSSAKTAFILIKPDTATHTAPELPSPKAGTSPKIAIDESQARIMKPDGQVGRPGRGGYTLSEQLEKHGWNSEKYEGFLVGSTACCMSRADQRG